MSEGVAIMEELIIEHTEKLSGEVLVQGSKNSALPILAATILCNDTCIIENCPHLSDVDSSIDILNSLGAKVTKDNGAIVIDSSGINNYKIQKKMMTKMRSSILFLGAIVSKLNKAEIYFPGGCKLGPRPIDWHLKALSQMGLKIDIQDDLLKCELDGKFSGAKIILPLPSVGATENIILAAVLAKGTTLISNAAREPEVCDLCNFLNSCGAKISGMGSSIIEIEGVTKLHGTRHRVIPDRIVAATFMAAVVATTGEVVVKNVIPEHLKSIISTIEKSGCEINCNKDYLRVKSLKRANAIGQVITVPYPGFPTDAQALLMAMCTTAKGKTEFIENIFENRYKHVDELLKLGADISLLGKKAVVTGVKTLYGNKLKAHDLRGAAALVIAALQAEGETRIEGLWHLDRGYETFEEYLKNIGAKIKRI